MSLHYTSGVAKVVNKFINADEAVSVIRDNIVVGICGFGMSGFPEALSKALERRFLKTGKPRNLTLICPNGQSDGKGNGIDHCAHKGLVKRFIVGHIHLLKKFRRLMVNDEIEAYNFPQGSLSRLFRVITAKGPGMITKTGLGTFVDPRIEGGKVNKKTKEDLVKLIIMDDEEWLLYKAFPINVGLIRGTTGDQRGNISIEREATSLEILSLAQAVKISGGILIAQVERIAKSGTLDPKSVKVPGMLVDYVVLAEDVAHDHRQTVSCVYDPALSGEIRVPLVNIKLPLSRTERRIIVRRAIEEIYPGAIVNLGIGIPAEIAGAISGKEIGDRVTLSVESGVIGGIALATHGDFGAMLNPEAIIDQSYQYDFYNGGVDIAFMGFGQVDPWGNVNASKFGLRIAGCGGFIDITQNAKKVVFCGTFTSHGLKIQVKNGRLQILEEGEYKKFVNKVDQITFSGEYARGKNQYILLITERAVFRLEKSGWILIEIAPGIDVQKDILDKLHFDNLRVSQKMKEMDKRHFRV